MGCHALLGEIIPYSWKSLSSVTHMSVATHPCHRVSRVCDSSASVTYVSITDFILITVIIIIRLSDFLSPNLLLYHQSSLLLSTNSSTLLTELNFIIISHYSLNVCITFIYLIGYIFLWYFPFRPCKYRGTATLAQ